MRASERHGGWGVCLLVAVLFWAGLLAAPSATAAAVEPPPGAAAEVEVAWLADVITFPYPLRAGVLGGTLEVHGTVPSAAVRKQALNAARVLWTGGPVVDRLKIAPPAALVTPPPPPERLRADLTAQLRRSMPALAAQVRVDCDVDGRVFLTGRAATAEEKRAVSQALRGVPGCSCVVNRLVLPGARPASEPAAPRLGELGERVRQAVYKACPQARDVKVTQSGPQHFHVEMLAPDEAQGAQFANRVLRLEALQRLHLEVLVHVPK